MKERDAYYCNLKILLLFLVVYGHWIEPYIEAVPWAGCLYRVIYTVHMPLFVFLSGTFLTSGKRAKAQAVRMLALYLAAQGVAVLARGAVGSPLPFHRPYWHLWYLLSLSQWSALCWGLERWGRLSSRPLWVRGGALLLAVGIGCGAGCVPWIGRDLSLSRTLVFFPYILAGQLCPGDRFRGNYGLGIAALAGFGILYLRLGLWIPPRFFYQAEPYGALGAAQGIWMRLACYGMGGLFGVGLLALVPGRRLTCSRMGTDTLGVYLLHIPLVLLFRLLPLSPLEMALTGPAASLWIVRLLDQLFRWRGQLYAVRSGPAARKGNQHDFQRNL